MMTCRRNGLCHVHDIFLMSIGSMVNFNFKNFPCRSVECKGEGPQPDLGANRGLTWYVL